MRINKYDKRIRDRIIKFRLGGLSYREISDIFTAEGRKVSYQRVYQIHKNNRYKQLIEERMEILNKVREKNTSFCALCGKDFTLYGLLEKRHTYMWRRNRWMVIVCEDCSSLLRKARRKSGIGKFHNLFFIKSRTN